MESTVNEYEIPFGIAKRKPYIPRINSRGEYPAYRFVTMTEKNKYGEYGLGLINTGVAGVEVMDGNLWTTLLRAPVNEYAGMVKDETSSDHGVHEFNFSIVPYAGDWRESGIVKYAQILNSPPLIFNGHHDRIKGIEIDKENVVLSAVKKNDDGKKVIRFYETMGKSTECVIRTNAEEAWDSDMNEGCGKTRTLDNGALMVKMNPYEIKTIIIK